jgi:hypothetical protein
MVTVMMAVLMSLEFCMFICHFDQNELMFGKGMGGVMLVRVIGVIVLRMFCL